MSYIGPMNQSQPAEPLYLAHQATDRQQEIGGHGLGRVTCCSPCTLMDMTIHGKRPSKGWHSPKSPPATWPITTVMLPALWPPASLPPHASQKTLHKAVGPALGWGMQQVLELPPHAPTTTGRKLEPPHAPNRS